MEHLLENLFSETTANLRGLIFGFVHVSIMLVGYYSAFSINRFLKIISNGYVAGIFGAALSHIIADVIASYLDPHIRSMILGIVIGGLIPLAFIPLLERFVTKSKNHIVTGDHEDIKKDLKTHSPELRIQKLESKFAQDFNQNTFDEIIRLKKEQNIN